MRQPLQRLLVAATVLGTGCHRPSGLWTGRAMVGPERTTFRPAEPIRAPGPVHEVCLIPVRDTVEPPYHDPDSLYVWSVASLRPEIVLVRPDGRRDTLGYEGERHPATGSDGEAGVLTFEPLPPQPITRGHLTCFWAREKHEPGRVYEAIEIRMAGQRMRIREVRWWSGERRPFL